MSDVGALFDRLRPEQGGLTEGEQDAWMVNTRLLLDSIKGQHAEKKRLTILALLDARLAGRSEESVWKLPQTCSRNVYHEKWKHDATFAYVLGELTRLVMEWRSEYALRRLKNAAERLAFASPDAVEQAVEKLTHADPNVSLKAAFGILDRAGVDTAVKGAAPRTNIVLSWGEPGEDDDAHNARAT